jgi:hypothetical protein
MNQVRLLTTLVGLVLSCAMVQAQPQDRGGGRNFPPGDNVVGKVTSSGKDSLVVAPMAGGDTVTVKVSDTTRVMKDRQPAKLSDIKVNDLVFVRGQLNGGVITAAAVGVVNPEMAQRMQQGGFGSRGNGDGGGAGFRGGPGGGAFNREDLGKKFIAGEVKAVNETRLTIARPDGQTQEIEVDENTSFKRGNESITLPDIKVGDFVRGPGELKPSGLKNEVFVSKELSVGRPPRMRMGDSGNPPQPPPQTPPSGSSATDKPATQPPPQN